MTRSTPDKHRNLDERFMRECLDLAQAMLGRTAPNPAVGCVIVRGERVVGRGATASGGRPHAETQALAQAGSRSRGATAYVSLEPCAHHGQTPPCAQALIDAQVDRVVIGCGDPYPKVRGLGIGMLRRGGIKVEVGVLEDECRRLNEGFITRVTTGRPFGLLKMAVTLDGRIASASGDSRWISSPESRELVHQWRNECDVVMVGAGTLIADNPRLTCRISGGRDPVRVVVDANLRSDPASRIFRQRSQTPTIIATSERNAATAKQRYNPRTRIITTPLTATGGLDLLALMRELAREGWSKVMIEGGAHLAGAALQAGVIDRVAFFVAPKLLGGGLSPIAGLATHWMRQALPLDNLNAHRVGSDWLLEGTIRRSTKLKIK